ncbi:hypothetical protein GGR57DRAFT_409375 [Xylariaceae sp. FL1272]|nr:hypothetical protein GGR57DRAFT_409375 [Xylariaceae sp. FL1272]
MKMIRQSIWTILALCAICVSGNCSLVSERVTMFAEQLKPKLSETASISFPGSDGYANSTARWSVFHAPTFSVAVAVSTEEDVRQTVAVANENSLQFLAVAGHHGGINSLGALNCGVAVDLKGLNRIKIQTGADTALIEGGAMARDVNHVLWEYGKWTVTAVCDCVSLLGPALGGGHGWNQGHYGLAGDQIVEANLVLGNGSMIKVSADSHEDLFWGLRGAGHNFGIVTSVQFKIYDVPDGNSWTVAQYSYTQDKLEMLFGVLNGFVNDGKQLVELRHWTTLFHNPVVDPINASFTTWLIFEGSKEDATPYTSQLEAVGPVLAQSTPTNYIGLSPLTLNNCTDTSPLDPRYSVLRFPIDLKTFNTTATREAYELLNNVTMTYPELNGSTILFEGYSVQAVKEIPEENTAYPDRFNNLLVASVIRFASGLPLIEEAQTAGHSLRRVLLEGSGSTELHAYVNYAVGEESFQAWYGYEDWRIKKLKKLKSTYDPAHQFSFYAPIP